MSCDIQDLGKMKSIWYSEHEQPWNALLKRYWSLVKDENVQVELTLSRLRPADIASMNAEQWYNFLFTQYFVWKYSAKNSLATTRNKLKTYLENHELALLDQIRLDILSLNLHSIANCLQTTTQIRGLGVAGASGLLSLVYPEKFATLISSWSKPCLKWTITGTKSST